MMTNRLLRQNCIHFTGSIQVFSGNSVSTFASPGLALTTNYLGPPTSMSQAQVTSTSSSTTTSQKHRIKSAFGSEEVMFRNKQPAMQCTVCFERPRDAFLTCGHTFCMVCATQIDINQKFCPFCRERTNGVHPLFN